MAAVRFLNNLSVKGTGTVLDIQGTQGQLFSITDSLTGDLFSVSDISGVPILNVNSSGAITIDGTLTSNGQITGTELEGTSLDINGNADISGNITNAGWTGDVIASAYLDTDTAHLTTTQTFSGSKTFSALASFTMDGNTITGIDDSGEFTDNDSHIMTSAAVNDRIQASIIANTDTQDLSISGTTLSLTNSPDVTIPQRAVSTSVSSTSTTVAGTSSAVKSAYDRGSTGITNAASAQTTANAALPKAGGTISGDVVFGSNSDLIINDGGLLRLGNGDDLKIYHDGSNSYIEDSGVGNLKIRTNALNVMNAANNENLLSATENGAVTLYYDNASKLTTATGGVNVTGTVTATTFSGDLNGTINTATTAVTQSASNNSTKVATTAYVDAQVATVVDSAPGTLNTLNELAAALGDDASFSTTVTNSIAAKLPLAGGTMSGAIAMGNQNITGAGTITGTTLTGTSLDINGNADISGDLTGLDNVTSDNYYINDTNTRLHEGTGNALRITTGTGYIDIGSMNSGWIHFQGNKPYYFNQALSMDADLKPYSTSGARNLGATGNVWNHVYAKGYFIDSTEVIDASRNLASIGTIGSGAITSTGKITGTELEGTSLDINGNADISGNLTGVDDLTMSGNLDCADVDASGTITGNGSGIDTINGSNISSGTVAAARVATLNQNTTGSSGSCTGNAATASAVAFSGITSLPEFVDNSQLQNRTTTTPDTAGDGRAVTFKYMSGSATNRPTGSDHSLMTMAYSNDWQTQIAQDWRNSGRMYLRGQNNGTWSSWNQVWDASDFSVANVLNSNVTSVSGNAGTATALATARNIGGVSFDGTSAINLPGVNTAGNQNTSGTAAIATACTITANNSGNETIFPVFVDGATGTQGLETDTGFTFNPSTGTLTTQKIATDVASIVENNKSNAALMTLTGQGAGNQSNISLHVAGNSTSSNVVKIKMTALAADDSTSIGAGILSYLGDGDTFNIGQSTTHNSMAISIDNDDVATFTNTATLSGGFVLDGNTITGVDNASEFTDNDNHIMTSTAIKNKIADNDNSFMLVSTTTTQTGNKTFSGNLYLNSDSTQLQFGADNDMQLFHNGANGEINNATGNFTIDAAGDIILDADSNDVIIKDAGADRLTFNFTSTGHFYNVLSTADKTWGVKGTDGSTAITALSIDMANAGKATFNNDVVAFSDKKLKENIQTLDGKKVLEMRGVSFTRKDTKEQSSGVIAQEMQKVAPELVSESEGTLGVAYGNLVGYLIEAVKDQQKQIDELKAMCNGCSK